MSSSASSASSSARSTAISRAEGDAEAQPERGAANPLAASAPPSAHRRLEPHSVDETIEPPAAARRAQRAREQTPTGQPPSCRAAAARRPGAARVAACRRRASSRQTRRTSPSRGRAAALPRTAGARGARADPRLRRAARTPKLRRCVKHRQPGTGPTISFARGAPSLDIVDVEGLQRRRRARVRQRPGGDDRLRHLGRLPAPARVDRRPPRRRARARARHQRLDAGRRVPVRAARAQPATT